MHAVRPDKWKCLGRGMSWCLDLPPGMGILLQTALSPDKWSEWCTHHSLKKTWTSEVAHQVFKPSTWKKKCSRSYTEDTLPLTSERTLLKTTSDKWSELGSGASSSFLESIQTAGTSLFHSSTRGFKVRDFQLLNYYYILKRTNSHGEFDCKVDEA